MSLNHYVKSGRGYVLSEDVVTGKINAEVHNSSHTEPAYGVGAYFAAIPIILGFVKTLWPNILPANTWDIVFYLVALFIPILTALSIRGKVWSPASVSKVLKEAIEAAESTRKK